MTDHDQDMGMKPKQVQSPFGQANVKGHETSPQPPSYRLELSLGFQLTWVLVLMRLLVVPKLLPSRPPKLARRHPLRHVGIGGLSWMPHSIVLVSE